MKYIKTYEKALEPEIQKFTDFLEEFISHNADVKISVSRNKANEFGVYYKASEFYHRHLFTLTFSYSEIEYFLFRFDLKFMEMSVEDICPKKLSVVMGFLSSVIRKFTQGHDGNSEAIKRSDILDIQRYMNENFELYRDADKYNL